MLFLLKEHQPTNTESAESGQTRRAPAARSIGTSSPFLCKVMTPGPAAEEWHTCLHNTYQHVVLLCIVARAERATLCCTRQK